MRHIRLTGQNLKHLSFTNKITEILNELNKFDEKDKLEREVDKNSEAGCSSSGPNSTLLKLKKTAKYSKTQRRKYNTRASNKKIKFCENVIKLRKIAFKCKVCDFIERKRKLMLQHLQGHVGSPRSCIKCRKTFNGKVPFEWHLNYYCNSRLYDKWKYKCNLCPREFISKRTLESHLQGHKRNNCAYCDQVLTQRVELIRHLLCEHSVKLERDTYKCDHCEKRYIKKCSLYYHLRQHVPEKFVCLECGRITETHEEYEEHKRQHDGQKHFTCSKCGDKFSRRQQYLYHVKRHNQYKCITCNESYASRFKAVKHKQKGHKVEGLNPRFLCPHCSLAFHREGRFHIHMRKHTEENRSVNCKYCKKTFNSPYAYYKHCITINHEKFSPEINDIACNKCGKHFAKRYDLRQHMYRVHNISKEFVSCQFCDYKTVHKCNMDRHVALHFRKEKEFTCEYCGKSCDSIASLNDHITYNHIQTKQFKCDKCDKSFKRNSELVRHQDSHSDERPHSCTLCNKSYKRVNHLKRHQQQAHQMSQETRRIKRIGAETEQEPAHSANNIVLSNQQLGSVIQEPVSLTQVHCAVNNSQQLGTILQEQEHALLAQANNKTVLHNQQFSAALKEQEPVLLTFPGDVLNSSAGINDQFAYFLPDRSWNLDNEDLCRVYNDVSLSFENQFLCEDRDELMNNGR